MKKLLTIILLVCAVGVTAQTTTQYAYDNLGRLTKVTYSNGAVQTYSYDANGNRISEIIIGSTGIIQIKDGSAVSLYPNPVKSDLFIKSEIEITQINIYSLQGKILNSVASYKNNDKIDVSSL